MELSKKVIVLAVSSLLVNTSLSAQEWYLDGGVSIISLDDGADTLEPTNVYFRGGYNVNDTISLGLESNVTLLPDSIASLPDVDFSISTVTFFVRASRAVSSNVTLYAQIGLSSTEIIAEFNGVEVSADDDDTMFGFGADINLNKDFYLALNYSNYNSDDSVDINIDAFNIGLGKRF